MFSLDYTFRCNTMHCTIVGMYIVHYYIVDLPIAAFSSNVETRHLLLACLMDCVTEKATQFVYIIYYRV